MAKPIELTLSYFGKTISQKQYSSVLHVGDLYKMFRGMIIAEFGQDTWDNLTKEQGVVENLQEAEMVEATDDKPDFSGLSYIFKNLY